MNLRRFKRLVFLSGLSRLAVRLYQQLEDQTGVPIVATTPAADLPLFNSDLMFLDVSADRDASLAMIQRLELETPDAALCLYGVSVDADLSELINFPIVRGVISNNQTQRHLLEAVAAMDRGECWFSRQLFNQLANLRHTGFELSAAALFDGLTKREQQVLQLISRGLNTQAIAEQLYVSPHTVKTHKKNLYRKLGAHSEQQLRKRIAGH